MQGEFDLNKNSYEKFVWLINCNLKMNSILDSSGSWLIYLPTVNFLDKRRPWALITGYPSILES